jgi:hypothetical protein
MNKKAARSEQVLAAENRYTKPVVVTYPPLWFEAHSQVIPSIISRLRTPVEVTRKAIIRV